MSDLPNCSSGQRSKCADRKKVIQECKDPIAVGDLGWIFAVTVKVLNSYDLLKKAAKPRRYTSLYRIMAVLVSVFFLFAEVIGNAQVRALLNKAEYTLPIWLTAFTGIFIIISFLYYHYLSVYILEEKLKDYGILVSLGKDRETIKRLFFRDMALSLLPTVLGGLASGSLVYTAAMFLLEKMRYLTFEMAALPGYLLVFAVYFLIFILNMLRLNSWFTKMSIQDMLSCKRAEKYIRSPGFCTYAGIFFLAAGFIFCAVSRSAAAYSFAGAIFPMLCLAAGAWLLILSFPFWFFRLMGRKKKWYHKNLFFISQLRTNFKKYAKLLTAAGLLIIFGVFLLSADMRYAFDKEDHSFEKPYDFSVIFDDFARSEDSIKMFEAENEELLQKSVYVELTQGAIPWDSEEYTEPVFIMPERSYTRLTGKKPGISGGQLYVLSQFDRERTDLGTQMENGVEWGFQPPGSVRFRVGNQIFEKELVKEIWEIVFNMEEQKQRTYVLNDEDYDEPAGLTGSGGAYFIKAADEESLPLIKKSLSTLSVSVGEKAANLAELKQGKWITAVLLLIVTALLLFSLVSLLVLRIRQNLKEEKRKYLNLYTLGFTGRQLAAEIKKEMSVLFFLPFLVGTPIALCYTVFVGVKTELRTLGFALLAAFLFFAVEYSLYRLTVKFLKKELQF